MSVLAAVCVVQTATASEIIHGKVRVSYSRTGLIRVFHDDVEVIRRVYFYRYDDKKPSVLTYVFPSEPAALKLNPRLVQLADENGRQTGSMITWTLVPDQKRMTGISSDEKSFVRLFVTETQVRIQIRVVPKAPEAKGYGELGLYVPAASFVGGRYRGMAGKKEITEKFPPPGAPLERAWCMPYFSLQTENGLQMRLSLRRRSLQMIDYRNEKVEYRKNTWRFFTVAGWAIDEVLTLEFTELSGNP